MYDILVKNKANKIKQILQIKKKALTVNNKLKLKEK